MSTGAVANKGLGALIKRAFHEIPEVAAAQVAGLFGVGLCGFSIYKYYDENKDNRRYKERYTVYRHDDPRVAKLRTDYLGDVKK